MKKSAKTKPSKKVTSSMSMHSFSQEFVYAAIALLFACLLVVLYQNRKIKMTVDAINDELRAEYRSHIKEE